MKSLRSTGSGFTLVEFMVVVAILGILASIALPSFQSLTQSQQVKNASFELFSSLSLARSEAIKRNCNVNVAMDPDGWGKGWTIESDSTCALPNEVIKSQGMLKGVVITLGSANVVYARTGRATAAASFQMDVSPVNTNVRRCIKIELSGMPRSTKTTGACP